MALTNISLKNFTVFSDGIIPLAQGVNVLIGSNGTGKTQLLKGIYGCCESARSGNKKAFFECFHTNSGVSLARDYDRTIEFNLSDDAGIGDSTPETDILLGSPDINRYGAVTALETIITVPRSMLNAVYIPVKDMLTHARGLLAMAQKYQAFPFDKPLLDSIEKSERWIVKEQPKILQELLHQLEKCIGGKILYENDEFYITRNDGRKISFELEAEGYKKLGILWQLLMNESIIPGSVLLWDEPESNLNPEFLSITADSLLALSRLGVQVVFSTHSYILAKYVELKKNQEDKVLFHSFYHENGLVHCESTRNFKDLKHNSIMDAFEVLMDEIYKDQVGE